MPQPPAPPSGRCRSATPNCPDAGSLARAAVLDGAAVGACGRCADRLAGHRLGQRHLHVVGRARDIGRIGAGLAVDGAGVDQRALGVDDIHVGRGARAVGPAQLAILVHQRRGDGRTLPVHPGRQLRRGQVVAVVGRGGVHRQPDGALRRGRLLRGLHVLRAVVLAHIRAAGVHPLQHHTARVARYFIPLRCIPYRATLAFPNTHPNAGKAVFVSRSVLFRKNISARVQ